MSTLRPYYNPATFRSPIKGYDELGLVTTTHAPGGGDYGAGAGAGGVNATAQGGSGGSGFVYLDVTMSDTGENLKTVGNKMMKMYGRAFVQQPWEVSRLLMQVGQWAGHEDDDDATQPTPMSSTTDNDDDDEDEEVDYFTAVTGENLRGNKSNTTRKETKRESYGDNNSKNDDSILIKPVTLQFLDIASALGAKEGYRGVWRGLNASFFYDALSSMLDAWLTGFLSSVSGIPDPHFVEVLHSPSPLVSLSTAVCAGVLTSIALSPLDMIRTQLMVTALSAAEKYPRSIRQLVWKQDSFLTSINVLIPTVFNSGLTTAINKSTPYLLYSKLGIDKYNSPSLFNLMSLLSSIFEVTVKLPFETMTKRAHLDELQLDPDCLIIRPVRYKGFVGTFWAILTGEDRPVTLFRGWRLSVLGTFGNWGWSVIQNDEQSKERF